MSDDINKKPVLVLWSGGLDSTYIVWKHLELGDNVCTIYIDLENNQTKSIREIAARSAIKNILKEKFPNNYIEDKTVNVLGLNHNSECSLAQPMIWGNVLLNEFKSNIHSHVETGYIKGDCFWHIKHDFEQYVHYGNKAFFLDRPDIVLKYPIEWDDKDEIYERYTKSEIGKELLHHVTWCESMHVEPCKDNGSLLKCVPCKTMEKIMR